MNKGFLTVTLIALFLSGCASTGMKSEFKDNGLPKPQYYVGGGFKLSYRAPGISGTVHVVEAITGKLIITESLGNHEVFTLDIDPRDEDMHMRLKSFGVDPLNVKFELYFVPVENSD